MRKDKGYHEDPVALKQLKAISSCFNQADRIIVATDAGREGELIFRWIYRHLNSHKPFDRLWISSLTDKAIREGLANIKPGSHYDHLYYAAQARAEADWLMGINASRALSIAYRGGYSLGRVQTPTLAMVCHRYMEHRDFTSVPYWKLTAMIEDEGLSIKAVSLQNFDNEATAQTALTSLRSIGSVSYTHLDVYKRQIVHLDTAYQAHHCPNGIDELGRWVKIGSDHLGRFVDARHTIALGKGCRTCHHQGQGKHR